MKKTRLSLTPEKIDDKKGQERKRASAERLESLSKRQLIVESGVSPSSSHTQHLVRLRTTTIQPTLQSLKLESPPGFHPEKTGPTSNEPNLGALRHDETATRRLVMQAPDGTFHNVNPDVLPVTPVKQNTDKGVFISPERKEYMPSASTVTLAQNAPRLIPLVQVQSQSQTTRKPRPLVGALFPPVIQQFPQHARIIDVTLSYANFVRPSGHQLPINNKQAQGGYSANELVQIQLNDFEKGLVDLGFANQKQMQEYSKRCKEVHHEHTHRVAAHFGILKTQEGQTLNPRHPSSTFVAPAALNSEMMLFEKFTDFLLYINYFQHGFNYNQDSVQYICTTVTIPSTTQVLSLTLQIKDFRTGKTFAQTWDKPYEVTAKPAAAMYTTLLMLLKANLEDKPILGRPVSEIQENKSGAAPGPF
jgi:hypothetical protein